MKINFVSYLNPFKYSGGGEIVNRRIIEAGIKRGHKFNFTFAKNRIQNYDHLADMDFLVDIFNYPETLKSRGAWIKLDSKLIYKIINARPFIHLTNAYADICNLGYLPCSGASTNPCSYKSEFELKRKIVSRDLGKDCFATRQIVRDSFINSVSNIYVSPLHQQITNKVLGIDDMHKSIVIKPLIDVNVFYNKNGVRDIEYLFVGVLSEAKGVEALRRNFADKDIVLVGDIHPREKLDFGRYLGKLPYREIPEIMNRAKNFVFLPRWPEPQGRVVVEAALSGCKLIVNENVGAMSFPFDISDPENLRNAEGSFWDELESKIAC